MKKNCQVSLIVALGSVLCITLLCPVTLSQGVSNMAPGSTVPGGGSAPVVSPPGTEFSEKIINPTLGSLATQSSFSSPGNGPQSSVTSTPAPQPSTTSSAPGLGLLSKVKEIIKVGKSSTQAPAQAVVAGGQQQSPQEGGEKKEGLMAKVNELFGIKKDDKEGEKGEKGKDQKAEGASIAGEKNQDGQRGSEATLIGQNSNDRNENLQKSANHEQQDALKDAASQEPNNKLNNSPNNQDSAGGAFESLTDIVKKGSEAIRDTMHKISDKARQRTDQIGKKYDEVVRKPISQVSGSGTRLHEGKAYEHKPEEPAKPQGEKNKQGGGGGGGNSTANQQTSRSSLATNQAPTIKDLVKQAKQRGIMVPYDPKNYAEKDTSVVVEVLDKAHELSKYPAQNLLRPIDKLLGYEKNPLLRVFDNSFDFMRAPLKTLAKPVDQAVTGAFTTVDENRNETHAHLMEKSEDERAEIKNNEDEEKKRSITGDIADKLFDLYTKPLEILLKPLDQLLGYKKNPMLHKLRNFYDLSKIPVDSLIKPAEQILTDMAEDEELIKFDSNYDPKLVSRLADGSVNIFERVVGTPMEFILGPLNFVLGFNDPGRKSPIAQAARELKNSSLRGIELWTKPIDRIIKEIADIGDKNKSARERELERIKQMHDSTEVVKKLEHIHRKLQEPVELWLRPISMAMGVSGEGKLPVLRTWDLFHELLKRPLQVVSKPIEDKLFSRDNKSPKKDWSNIDISKDKKDYNKEFESAISAPAYREEKNNVITDSIRKIEKLAARPVTFLTSPIRRIIMAGDKESAPSGDNSKSHQAPDNDEPFSPKLDDHSNDKILTTFDKINNVVLRPLELLTQPVSDMFLDGGSRKDDKQNDKQQ